MSNDPHAGQGGSYEMDAHGNRVLRERTGWVPDAPAADAQDAPEAKPAKASHKPADPEPA